MVGLLGPNSLHPRCHIYSKSRKYLMHVAKKLCMLPVCLASLHIVNIGSSRFLVTCETNFDIENACAAIAKILHFNKQSVEDPQAVINQWYYP